MSDSTNYENSAAGSEEELAAEINEALSDVAQEIDQVAVLTNDLQRLQADFSNYRKRNDRERSAAHELSVASVLAELLPLLDDIERAEAHGELVGGFKSVGDRLINVTEKLGLTKYAAEGVPFDPLVHEALMHETSPDVTETTVTKVLQPGYSFKERVIRPARVVVSDPEA
jgi:molecular chaperone GrpE